MKKIIYKILPILLVLFIFIPTVNFAQGTSSGLTYECPPTQVNGAPIYGNCTFDDLVRAVINFFNQIVPIVLSLSVVVIAYAGYQYMASGTNPGARTKANRALKYMVIGVFFILAAWLIVSMIGRALLTQEVIDVTPVMIQP